jgi:hypothetical protein
VISNLGLANVRYFRDTIYAGIDEAGEVFNIESLVLPDRIHNLEEGFHKLNLC